MRRRSLLGRVRPAGSLPCFLGESEAAELVIIRAFPLCVRPHKASLPWAQSKGYQQNSVQKLPSTSGR